MLEHHLQDLPFGRGRRLQRAKKKAPPGTASAPYKITSGKLKGGAYDPSAKHLVITSYSIHYTKLYDAPEMEFDAWRRWWRANETDESFHVRRR